MEVMNICIITGGSISTSKQ